MQHEIDTKYECKQELELSNDLIAIYKKIKELDCKYISDIPDENQYEFLTQLANYCFYNLALQLNVDIDHIIVPELDLSDGKHSHFDAQNNEISIGKHNALNDGESFFEVFAEEVGHYFSAFLKGRINQVIDEKYSSIREHQAEEFLGFLSRRYIFNTLNEEERTLFLFEESPEVSHKAEQYIKDCYEYIDLLRELCMRNLTISELKESETELKTVLRHYPAYIEAAKVDMNIIQDWQELFTLEAEKIHESYLTEIPESYKSQKYRVLSEY